MEEDIKQEKYFFGTSYDWRWSDRTRELKKEVDKLYIDYAAALRKYEGSFRIDIVSDIVKKQQDSFSELCVHENVWREKMMNFLKDAEDSKSDEGSE